MFLDKLLGLNKLTAQEEVQKKQTVILRNLIRQEAQIGGALFGPVKRGGKREFFCLDESTWIWHEEWIDEQGQKRILNTRYDMRPSGILKAQNGQGYQMVTEAEAGNLLKAINSYVTKVKKEIYQVA